MDGSPEEHCNPDHDASDALRIDAKATTFVNDTWIADRIGMCVATIRSQRFKRRHGLPHWLDIDATMIGSKPRYRLADALDWLARQNSTEK